MSVEYVRCNSNCSRYFINYSQSGKKQPYFSLEDAINKQQCWSYVEVQLDSRPCKPLLQKYKILPFTWQLYILVRIANSKDPYQDCSMPQDGGWFHPHCIIMYENIHRVQKSVKKNVHGVASPLCGEGKKLTNRLYFPFWIWIRPEFCIS